MGSDLVWLAVYVALSRVRRLSYLKSVGMGIVSKQIIEKGPPATIPVQFEKYFGVKEQKTALAAEAAMEQLGWSQMLRNRRP